jgi:hypothetical protein
MVNVAYSADVDHLDEAPREAEAERPNEPIRIRVQPGIFRKAGGAAGQYKSWLDVSWIMECKDAEEAIALREAMRVFFEQVGTRGPEAVRAVLLGETT